MQIKTVVFDFDGTLVDTAPIIQTLLNELRAEFNMTPLPPKTYSPWMSLGGTTLVRNSLELTDPDEIKKYLVEFRARYIKLPGTVSPLFKNVREGLELLSKNNIQIALCTNKPQSLIDKITEDWGITSYFNFMTTGKDDLTDKPNPRKLLTCIEQLNSTLEQSIFIGDACLDKITADNAKTKFGLFAGGYNDGVDESQCDIVFDDYLEFAHTILKHD
jgi:phosphoglycolate phosphatase